MTEAEPASTPLEFVLVAFEGDRLTRLEADDLLTVIDDGTVSVHAVEAIGKAVDGSAYRVSVTDPEPDRSHVARLAWGVVGLPTDDDVDAAADAMEPGTLAVLVVYEKIWPAPFVTAAWMSGGRLVTGARLAAEDVAKALAMGDPADIAGEGVSRP